MKACAKKTFWARLVCVLAIICMSFGFMACDVLSGLTRSVTKDDFEAEQRIDQFSKTVTITVTAKNDITDFALKIRNGESTKILEFGDMKNGDVLSQTAVFEEFYYENNIVNIYIELESGTCKLLK